MASIRMRKKPNFSLAISGLTTMVLLFLVGGKVLSAIGSTMNCTITPFNDALSLLGFSIGTEQTGTFNCTAAGFTGINAGTQLPNGEVSSTGLIGVIGVVAAASIVLSFVKVKF